MKILGVGIFDPMIFIALGLGALIIFMGFILGRYFRANKLQNATASKEYIRESKNSSNNMEQIIENQRVHRNINAVNKRTNKHKKRRETQQEFTHSWIVGALKGHTGPIFDMKFSSDDKFLASCGEDCSLVPERTFKDVSRILTTSDNKVNQNIINVKSTTSSSCNSEIGLNNIDVNLASTPALLSLSEQVDQCNLSRRQKKNRRASRELNYNQYDDNANKIMETYFRNTDQYYVNNKIHKSKLNSNVKLSRSVTVEKNNKNNIDHTAKINVNTATTNNCNNENTNNKNNNNNNSRNLRCRKNYDSGGVDIGLKREFQIDCLYKSAKDSQQSNYKGICNSTLLVALRRYVINPVHLMYGGYPVGDHYHGKYAYVCYKPHYRLHYDYYRTENYQYLDVNAQEFVPTKYVNHSEIDSSKSSSNSVENSDLEHESSSDNEKNSDSSESSIFRSSSLLLSNSDCLEKIREECRGVCQSSKFIDASEMSLIERECARCSKKFLMNVSGEYITKNRCLYHWGKKRKMHTSEGRIWQCCGHAEYRPGCTEAQLHVWTGLVAGINGPLYGYVYTLPCPIISHDGDYGIYALDCEMCYTRYGLEVTRVTVAGLNGKIVYDTLIKPEEEIIDYNTRFSGISAQDLIGVTKKLGDVQKDLINFIYSETILIGHALENDLRALKIIHMTVVDTCYIFPHELGYPHRNSLKLLAKRKLNREIQISMHNSVEDAKIVIDLMRYKVWEDYFYSSYRYI